MPPEQPAPWETAAHRIRARVSGDPEPEETIIKDACVAYASQITHELRERLQTTMEVATNTNLEVGQQRDAFAEENRLLRERCERMRVAAQRAYTMSAMRSEPYIPPDIRERIETTLKDAIADTPPPATVPTPGKENGK